MSDKLAELSAKLKKSREETKWESELETARERHRAVLEPVRAPAAPQAAQLTDGERVALINAEYKKMEDGRADYFMKLQAVRKNYSKEVASDYRTWMATWAEKSLAASIERDEAKRTELKKEAQDAWDVALQFQQLMHSGGAKDAAEAELRDIIDAAEKRIRELGGKLDVPARAEVASK